MKEEKKPQTKEKLTAQEILNLIDCQWADAKVVQKLGCVGCNKSWEIMKEIRNNLEKEDNYLPKGLVPMEKVVNYFKININYLKKVSKGDK